MPDTGDALSALFWLGEVPALVYVLYRCGLGLLSLAPRRAAPRGDGSTAFLILVAAHNEENVIAATAACLLGLDYPEDKRCVLIISDASTDGTAAAARAAGAFVLEKPSPATGKGGVIKWTLDRPEVWAMDWDAAVLLDADSRPAPDFLRVLDGAVVSGAKAIQARSESVQQYGWVSRGYAVNTTQRNRTWHQARERAGFNAALTGTGICLTRAVLRAHPHLTRTVTEDLEYTALLTRSGIRIHYLSDALIYIEQPHSLGSSVRQRLRWARGQIITAVLFGPGLIGDALRHRRWASLDLALYLALPSMTPLQAGLLLLGFGALIVPGWPAARIEGLPEVPVALVFAVVGLSVIVPYAALLVERRRPNWRDWAAYLLLMASWLPIAVFAAMTVWVKRWYRTPHGVSRTAPASAPVAAITDDDRLPASMTTGTRS